MHKTTIILIDDHELIRETWSMIVSSHPAFEVIGEAGSAEDGLKLVKALQPDMVLMDINLPGKNGIEATKELTGLFPAIKVMGVSLHVQPVFARAIMEAGAKGYVTKNSKREEMFTAITEVMNGNQYICQEIKSVLSEPLADDWHNENN